MDASFLVKTVAGYSLLVARYSFLFAEALPQKTETRNEQPETSNQERY